MLILVSSLIILPLIYAGNYGAGSYGKGIFGIGEVPVSPPSAPTGGGAAACTYDWQCTNWFPAECPETEIQERICANKGTCTGTVGMPNQTRTCIYEGPTEPFFDIYLKIPEQYKEICAGRKIKANIRLENYGKKELLDTSITYWIINQNNTLIAELKDTRKIEEEKLDFDIFVKIPISVPSGTYRLYAEIIYFGNKTALAGESFEVIERDYCKIPSNLLTYLPFILIGVGFITTFILIIILFKRFYNIKEKRRLRLQRKARKRISKVKKFIKKPKSFINAKREGKRILKKEKKVKRKLLRKIKKQIKKKKRKQKIDNLKKLIEKKKKDLEYRRKVKKEIRKSKRRRKPLCSRLEKIRRKRYEDLLKKIIAMKKKKKNLYREYPSYVHSKIEGTRKEIRKKGI